MPKKILRSIGLFLPILIVLCFAYLPVLFNQFIHHDDVSFFLRTPSQVMIPNHYQDALIGRPLNAMRLTSFGFFIDRVSDFTILRWLNVIFLGLSAWLMSLWLKDYCANGIHALLTALIIFTLPSYQLLAVFVGASATPIALFLALAAAQAAGRISTSADIKKRLTGKPFTLSVVLLLSSLLFYPAAAMYYWVMVAVEILSFQTNPRAHSQDKLVNLFSAGFGALGIYSLILLGTRHYFARFTMPGYNPYAINPDVLAKLRWFIEEPLFNALNLWNIFPNRSWAYALLLFILATCLLRLFQLYGELKNGKINRDQLQQRGIMFILFLALFPLSFLPGLAAITDPGFYRCLAGLTGMVVLTVLWAVNVWLRTFVPKSRDAVLSIILAIALATGISWANRNLYTYRVKPSMVELQYLKDNLEKIDISRLKSVHVIRPDPRAIKFRYDEFGTPMTLYHHNIIAALTCALGEINREKLVIRNIQYDYDRHLYTYTLQSAGDPTRIYQYPLRITDSLKNEAAPESDITIDMNQLYEQGQPLEYLRL